MDGRPKDLVAFQRGGIYSRGPSARRVERDHIERILLGVVVVVVVDQRTVATLPDVVPTILERKREPYRRVGVKIAANAPGQKAHSHQQRQQRAGVVSPARAAGLGEEGQRLRSPVCD